MAIDAPNNQKADITISPQKIAAQTAVQTQVQINAPKVETTLENINIKVGQAIQAKVLEVLDAVTTKSGQTQFNVSLEIAGKTVLVKTNIQLQPGQLIEVRINEKGELILPKPASQEIDQLIKAISKVLPFQQPVGRVIAQLLNSLSLLGENNAQAKVLTEQLAQILPKAEHLKPSLKTSIPSPSPAPQTQTTDQQLSSLKLIKQAMERSGIFMENKLANLGKAASSPTASVLESAQMSKASIAALRVSTVQNTTTTASATTGATTSPGTTTISASTGTVSIPGTSSMPGLTTTNEIPDLKAAISQSISLLNSVNTTVGGKPLARPVAEADLNLLVNPFDFPSQLSSSSSSTSRIKEDLSVGDMLKLLAGALNRIQFNQLNSLYQSQSSSSDSPIIQTWQMEIPFINQQKEIDPIQVRIDQEDANNNKNSETEKKSKWKVTLAFDFDRLGPLVVQINLMPPQISSTIWAERKETLKLVNDETHNLRESLSNIGLKVDDISCRHGQPNLKKTRLDQQIVDIKA